VLAGACAVGVWIWTEWFVTSPKGTDDVYVLQWLATLTLPGAALGLVCGLALAASPRYRRRAAGAVLACASYLGTAGVLGPRLGPEAGRVRIRAFEALAIRSEPLVTAIRRYEADHGKPPASLSALTPRYIRTVPSTGMGAYPAYAYRVGDDAAHYQRNPWALEVRCSRGILNWDRFLYLPRGNYPTHGFGGKLERVRDWAYVWE
jgi:hypothetical protein